MLYYQNDLNLEKKLDFFAYLPQCLSIYHNVYLFTTMFIYLPQCLSIYHNVYHVGIKIEYEIHSHISSLTTVCCFNDSLLTTQD